MVSRASVQLLLDQKVIERDWAGSMIRHIYTAIDHLEEYIGSGNAKYVFLAILVIVLILLWKRRK